MDCFEILYTQSYAYSNMFCLLFRAKGGEGRFCEQETFTYTSKRVGAQLDVQISPLSPLESLMSSLEWMIDSYIRKKMSPDIYQNE